MGCCCVDAVPMPIFYDPVSSFSIGYRSALLLYSSREQRILFGVAKRLNIDPYQIDEYITIWIVL
jgi:hypothetical protein